MSSSSSPNCNCPYCPSGIAGAYQIVVENIANATCNQCTDLNKTYLLPPFPTPGICSFGVETHPCAFTGWLLTFQLDVNAKPFAQLILGGTDPGLIWTCPLVDCLQKMTVNPIGDNLNCANWPSIPVTPVALTPAQLNVATCIPNSVKVCMQQCLATATVGAPLLCCYPPDPQACQNHEPCGCGTPVWATKQHIPFTGCSGCTSVFSCPPGTTVAGVNTAPTGGNACGCGCSSGTRKSSGGCGCGGGNPPKAIYSGGILAETQDRVAMLQAMVTPGIPGLNHGPGHVNILNGIMALQIVLPDGGPYSPDPFLT
ncbi:MAG TPA: hypothetical protein VND64_15240 [Pirellulales bacterium]|nr:hypothetical protein [Pirellulales bacterium]